MFRNTKAFSGFSVNDLQAAKAFYSETLGLDVSEIGMGLLSLNIAGSSPIIVYSKDNHEPATFTILNFPVANIDEAVDALAAKGVRFQHYDMEYLKTDAKGVARSDGQGPNIAWFTDPAGNILSVLEGE